MDKDMVFKWKSNYLSFVTIHRSQLNQSDQRTCKTVKMKFVSVWLSDHEHWTFENWLPGCCDVNKFLIYTLDYMIEFRVSHVEHKIDFNVQHFVSLELNFVQICLNLVDDKAESDLFYYSMKKKLEKNILKQWKTIKNWRFFNRRKRISPLSVSLRL